jgi:hypothetical protein
VAELRQQSGYHRFGVRLARSLSLVLDGGLASGVLDADPAAAAAARTTAAQLVAAALSTTPAPN